MMAEKTGLVARLAQALSTTIVPVAGKRPVLLDRVFRSALERMGFNNPDDRIPDIREKIAERFLEEIGPVMTEAELARLRVLVEHGITHEQASELFGVPVDQVRQALEGRALVRLRKDR